MMQSGEVKIKGTKYKFYRYHGSKIDLQTWMNQFYEKLTDHFENIPFGGLKLNGELLNNSCVLRNIETGEYSIISNTKVKK